MKTKKNEKISITINRAEALGLYHIIKTYRLYNQNAPASAPAVRVDGELIKFDKLAKKLSNFVTVTAPASMTFSGEYFNHVRLQNEVQQ